MFDDTEPTSSFFKTDGCSTESPGSDSQSNDDNVTLLAAIIAGLSAVILFLLVAISAAQFYRSRKKKQTSLVGHCTTQVHDNQSDYTINTLSLLVNIKQELANIESGDVDQVSVSTPTKQKVSFYSQLCYPNICQ